MRQYIKFVGQADKINKRLGLNHLQIEVLDLVAQAHLSEQVFFVGDLIGQKQIASQATLHRTFKELIGKKLLIAKTHKEDGRQKYIFLTKLALDRYKKLNQVINSCTS